MTVDAPPEEGVAVGTLTHQGRFFVFEGIDGSGKSTVARLMAERLEREGRPTVHTAEPTDSWVGDMVRRGNAEAASPFTETLLYIADRAEHTAQIDRWLTDGKYVVCDRYVGSTLAYQGVTLRPYLAGKAVEWLKAINAPFTIRPTITFLLLLEPEAAMARLGSRPGREKFERLDFLRKVDALYRQLAREDPSYIVIDASLALEEVAATVWGLMSRY